MIFGCILGGIFGALFFLSSQQEAGGYEGNQLLLPFYKISCFLLEWQKKVSKEVLSQKLLSDLQGLERAGYPDKQKFLENRLALVLLVLFAGTLLTLGAGFTQAAKGWEAVQVLERPDIRGESRMEDLKVRLEGEDGIYEIPMEIKSSQYSKKQKQKLLKKALVYLEENLLGENESADEVRRRIFLPKTVLEEQVAVEWLIDPIDMIDEDGLISEEMPEKGVLVQIQAELECGGEKASYEQYLQAMPPMYTKEEEILRSVQKAITDADEKSAMGKELVLPKEIAGKKAEWAVGDSDVSLIFCVLTIIFGGCTYLGQEEQLHKKAMERKRSLMLEYPNLLYRMSMLLGAGLTIQGTFARLAKEHRSVKKKKIHYAYGEVARAWEDMQKGIAESAAYETFGSRCQLPQYIKLGSILSQNLRKGSEGLLELLQGEAALSMEEQRQMAKKLGEEAGTKLLLPMMMMLVVVFIILMVPAMLSF